MAQVNGVDLRERGDVGGQILCNRHLRAFDQDRNHCDVGALERRGNLLSQVVVFSVQPTLAARQPRSQPVVTDQDENDPTGVERGVDPVLEVRRQRDRIHIDEDPGATKPLDQVVGQAPRLARRVVTPV